MIQKGDTVLVEWDPGPLPGPCWAIMSVCNIKDNHLSGTVIDSNETSSKGDFAYFARVGLGTKITKIDQRYLEEHPDTFVTLL